MEPIQPAPNADCALTRAEVENLLRSPHIMMSGKVRRRRFPRIAASFHLDDLLLTNRAQKALLRLKASRGLTDLSHLSIGDLLGLQNFGLMSLTSVLSSVLPVILDREINPRAGGRYCHVPVSAAVTAAAERLRAQSYSGLIHCTDPRFRLEAAAVLYVSNSSSDDPSLALSASLDAVAHRLIGRTRDFPSPESILDAIRKLCDKIAGAKRISLEQELKEITSAFATGRDARVALSFLGWDGHGAKTLEAVGNEFHMTAERVRQITNKLIASMRLGRPFAPILERAIAQITKRAPIAEDDMRAELCWIGITQSPFGLDGVRSAAKVFGAVTTFISEERHGNRTVVRHEDVGLSQSIVRRARKMVSHAGLGKVRDLCDRIGKEYGTPVENRVVTRVLQPLPSLRWLDERNERFFIADVPRNHLVTLVRKVLSVAPAIHVNEMRAAISSDFRDARFALPKSAVLEFCRIACGCRIEGDNIVADPPPRVAQVLSKGEQIAYSVLSEKGPLLHRADFERNCIERGMNSTSFAYYLGQLPIIARYGPDVYGLRGAQIISGGVEQSTPPTARLRNHGWTVDGKPWLAVELSQASLSSGVINVPRGIRGIVDGRYVLRTPDNSDFGKLVVSGHAAWGLRSFLKRRKDEAETVIVLTFNLQRYEAVIRVGAKDSQLTHQSAKILNSAFAASRAKSFRKAAGNSSG